MGGIQQVILMSNASETRTFVVTGGALTPEVPAGATALCSSRPSRNGDFVAYVIGEGEPVFRRYRETKDGKILLESLNALYDSYETTRKELLARGRLYVILSIRKDFYPVDPVPEGLKKMRQETENELLTFTEAQDALKIKRTKMYAMLRSGELQAIKVGKLWRIARSSIDSYLSGEIYSPDPKK